MGMPFSHPDMPPQNHYGRLDWQGRSDSGEVSISVSADCLCRLLRNRQLHVEDLTCLDAATQSIVRQMLLSLIR